MHPGHSVDNKIRIYADAEGRLWVTHEELLLCGYRNIEDFDIIYANSTFWELQAYAKVPKAWWIEEVPVGEETEEAYKSEAHEAAEGKPSALRGYIREASGGLRPLRPSTGFEPEARYGPQSSDNEDPWSAMRALQSWRKRLDDARMGDSSGNLPNTGV